MRTTLEQLKAMTNAQLYQYWCCGKFPFEYVRGCEGGCLTMHGSRGCTVHTTLEAETKKMGFDIASARTEQTFVPVLRANLEELYALRLFHDSLYPQPAPELFEAVATKEAHAEVCEKNLI